MERRPAWSLLIRLLICSLVRLCQAHVIVRMTTMVAAHDPSPTATLNRASFSKASRSGMGMALVRGWSVEAGASPAMVDLDVTLRSRMRL